MALMESMARGIPAIATDVGANAAMLADECGVIVAKSDFDAMERAVRAFADADVRRTVSENAVRKAREQYTTGVVLARLRVTYDSLQTEVTI